MDSKAFVRHEQAFDKWMLKVESIVVRATSVSVYDLPDQPYREWFDSGLSPIQAASKVRNNVRLWY